MRGTLTSATDRIPGSTLTLQSRLRPRRALLSACPLGWSSSSPWNGLGASKQTDVRPQPWRLWFIHLRWSRDITGVKSSHVVPAHRAGERSWPLTSHCVLHPPPPIKNADTTLRMPHLIPDPAFMAAVWTLDVLASRRSATALSRTSGQGSGQHPGPPACCGDNAATSASWTSSQSRACVQTPVLGLRGGQPRGPATHSSPGFPSLTPKAL